MSSGSQSPKVVYREGLSPRDISKHEFSALSARIDNATTRPRESVWYYANICTDRLVAFNMRGWPRRAARDNLTRRWIRRPRAVPLVDREGLELWTLLTGRGCSTEKRCSCQRAGGFSKQIFLKIADMWWRHKGYCTICRREMNISRGLPDPSFR